MSDFLYPIARSLLFRCDAERAHHLGIGALRLGERLGILKHTLAGPRSADGDGVEVCGLHFPNRIGLAAGLDKEGNAIDALGRLGFGFVEIGTLTPRPQAGNPKPRLFRLVEHEAIINRMGFNNPGIAVGIANLRKSKNFRGVVGINIGKNKDTPNERADEDYLACLAAAWPVADYIAVNLSSPNTPGLRELQAADLAGGLLERLKRAGERLATEHGKRVPVFFKVAPDLDHNEIRALAKVFREGGLDGLIATNTTLDRKAVAGHPLASQAGGLSGGRAPNVLAARSDEVVAAFASELGSQIPVIGVGGIASLADAKRKLAAGAVLVQLYSAFIFQGPDLVRRLVEGLAGNGAQEEEFHGS